MIPSRGDNGAFRKFKLLDAVAVAAAAVSTVEENGVCCWSFHVKAAVSDGGCSGGTAPIIQRRVFVLVEEGKTTPTDDDDS